MLNARNGKRDSTSTNFLSRNPQIVRTVFHNMHIFFIIFCSAVTRQQKQSYRRVAPVRSKYAWLSVFHFSNFFENWNWLSKLWFLYIKLDSMNFFGFLKLSLNLPHHWNMDKNALILHFKRCARTFLSIIWQMAMVHIILYDKIHVWFKFQSNRTKLKPPPKQ